MTSRNWSEEREAKAEVVPPCRFCPPGDATTDAVCKACVKRLGEAWVALERMRPCAVGLNFCEGKTKAQVWETCEVGSWMAWLYVAQGGPIEALARVFLVDEVVCLTPDLFQEEVPVDVRRRGLAMIAAIGVGLGGMEQTDRWERANTAAQMMRHWTDMVSDRGSVEQAEREAADTMRDFISEGWPEPKDFTE